MGQIWDFLRSFCEPKCTETDLKKSQICTIWWPIWPNLDTKFDNPGWKLVLCSWMSELAWPGVRCHGCQVGNTIWANLGLFKISFSALSILFGSLIQNVLKLILNLTSPRFVPFGTNLTHFEAKIGHRWCDMYPMETSVVFSPLQGTGLFTHSFASLLVCNEINSSLFCSWRLDYWNCIPY